MYLHELEIGNVKLKNNILLAPMAGITDLPFRLICEKFEPGLVCTEMVSSKAILYGDEKTKKLMNLNGEKRPVSIQIFGSDIEAFACAAKYVSEKADIVDINMGCPAPKVVKNGDGSKLLLDLEKAKEIMQSVVKNSKVPVTLKFRKHLAAYSKNLPNSSNFRVRVNAIDDRCELEEALDEYWNH